ncbi:ATP-binding protein [Streptomyces sp. CAU 1734]|uniref:ATP-binding protein n=1 Tax=Streptomyces sp. CAU 1734 TaxID=3140360 RepID=UPI0032617929
MDVCRSVLPRKAWELAFLAEPSEVAALRRLLRLNLMRWGLPVVVDAAQLCASELVANVIDHVGPGTPAILAVSLQETYLRLEVRDPDTRCLPALQTAQDSDEGGRGMALVDAIAAGRWGVSLHDGFKTTWCELTTGLTSPDGHVNSPGVARAEALLALYGAVHPVSAPPQEAVVALAIEESAVEVMSDLLQWLCTHSCNVGEVMDRAQVRCDAELASVTF